jgi:hypothetical protein
MPDGVIRGYKDGKVTGFIYPPNYTGGAYQDSSKKGLADFNRREGLYYDPNPQTPVTPQETASGAAPRTEPTEGLKTGDVKMPDNSVRTYKNGLVVYVGYPAGTSTANIKTPAEINAQEGVQQNTFTGPVITPEPETPTIPLKQGFIKMPDGSKRTYIDGKVVSVAYPPGTTGPTINEINAAEGIKQAAPAPPPAPAPESAPPPEPEPAPPPAPAPTN